VGILTFSTVEYPEDPTHVTYDVAKIRIDSVYACAIRMCTALLSLPQALLKPYSAQGTVPSENALKVIYCNVKRYTLFLSAALRCSKYAFDPIISVILLFLYL